MDAVGTTGYGCDSVDQLLSENGPWSDDMVSYNYTNRLRSALSLEQPHAPAWTQAYGYDAAKRMATLSSDAGQFSYSYHSGLNGLTAPSTLIKKLLLPSGSYVTNNYDTLGRLGDRLKTSANAILNLHSYTYNQASQRTRQTRLESSYVDYTYDGIGQLKTAKGVDEESSTANRPHEQFGYVYDAAGNLNYRTNNTLLQTFTVNGLNQLTNNTRSGTLTVAGAYTGSPTNINVGGYAGIIYDDGTFAVTNRTLADGTNTWDAQALDALGRQATHSVSVYHPANVNYVYDLNGNMLTDGRRHFTYDDENQLTQVVLTNATKSVFAYDGKMRRRTRSEYAWQTSAWQLTAEVRYVYDGNLPIQERHYHPLLLTGNPQKVVTYTRGSDLSGSMQGAGGIGGLLARTEEDPVTLESSTACYHADGNGNVTRMIDEDEAVVAKYLYDPYGNTIGSSGTLAEDNLYRFSSKEYHSPSGLIYYLYRYYEPNLQRWPNRDPIGENGGINLYGFVGNRPVNVVDADGLLEFPRIPTIPSFPWPNPLPRPTPPPRSWPSWPRISLPEDPISCGNRIKNEVWEKFAPGGKVPPNDPSFHYGHCVAHCRIQRECLGGRFTSWLGGVGKEIKDELEQWGGKGAGWEGGDMDANRRGRKCGRHNKEKSCEEACKGM